MKRLLIFGRGYCGTAIAELAARAGFAVDFTSRSGTPGSIPFDAAEAAIADATHLVTTAAPGADGDPVLIRYAEAIKAAPHVRWVGYFSSSSVYGDRGGGWVDEDTPAAPSQERGRRRLAAEEAWSRSRTAAIDIFRVGGIYGPGRSAFDDLRSGRARRMIKPGHQFGRIHRDDIARAVVVAMLQERSAVRRVLNLVDDEPSESAAVVTEAAALLGVTPPEPVRYEDALPTMTPMARSFWGENRKITSAKTKAALGITWLYPTFREGLRGILQQSSNGGGQE